MEHSPIAAFEKIPARKRLDVGTQSTTAPASSAAAPPKSDGLRPHPHRNLHRRTRPNRLYQAKSSKYAKKCSPPIRLPTAASNTHAAAWSTSIIVQYLILAHARKYPQLLANYGNIALLNIAADCSLIDKNLAEQSRTAYLHRQAATQHSNCATQKTGNGGEDCWHITAMSEKMAFGAAKHLTLVPVRQS